MLRDRYFYPLAGLLIAGMIALALSFGSRARLDDADIVAQGWQMSGQSLTALQVSPGATLDYVDEEGGYVRLAAFTPFGAGPGSIGVFASLGPDYERAFSGRTLRIHLKARAAARDGLDAFDTAYFPLESAPSAWQVFDLSQDWQDYSYDVTLPITAAAPNTDYLSVFPGKAGEQKAMELASLRIEVLDR